MHVCICASLLEPTSYATYPTGKFVLTGLWLHQAGVTVVYDLSSNPSTYQGLAGYPRTPPTRRRVIRSPGLVGGSTCVDTSQSLFVMKPCRDVGAIFPEARLSISERAHRSWFRAHLLTDSSQYLGVLFCRIGVRDLPFRARQVNLPRRIAHLLPVSA